MASVHYLSWSHDLNTDFFFFGQALFTDVSKSKCNYTVAGLCSCHHSENRELCVLTTSLNAGLCFADKITILNIHNLPTVPILLC